jgi:hypothetical protein
VVEGWHPSEPGRVGYNVLLDDSWLGTFESLDCAATAAAAQIHASDGGNTLRLNEAYGVPGRQLDRPRLRVVEPTPAHN